MNKIEQSHQLIPSFPKRKNGDIENVEFTTFKESMSQLSFNQDQIRPQEISIQSPAPTENSLSSRFNNSFALFLKRFAQDETLYSYLKLDTWETEGDKEKAINLIIDCFRNKLSILNLSNLGLTSLPSNLNFPWITEVNLSGNSIKDLSPLVQLQFLEALNLSYNTMDRERGIPSFQSLKNLERLNSLILLNMNGDRNLIRENLKNELLSCESLQWTDSNDTNHILTRRPGELLSSFLNRRNRELSLETNLDSNLEASDLERLQNAVISKKLKNLDITPLLSKNGDILPWIHRFVSNDEYTSSPIWKKHPQLRPALAMEILSLLKYSMKNKEFYESVFAPLLHESVNFCGDRTLYFLNEMIRRKALFKAARAPIDEALSTFKNYFPVALIKKIAQRSVLERVSELLKIDTSISVRKALELEKEDLSITLNFLIEYNAPLAFSEIRYLGIKAETRRDFISKTKQELQNTLKSYSAFLIYLIEDPEWQRLLFKRNPSFKTTIQEITRLYSDEPLNRLEEELLNRNTPTYLERVNNIKKTFNLKVHEAFEEETHKYT